MSTFICTRVPSCCSLRELLLAMSRCKVAHSTLVRPRPLAGAYILYRQATHNLRCAHTTTRSEAARTNAPRYHSAQRCARRATFLRLHRPVLRWPMPAPHRRSNASPKLREGARLGLVRSRVGEPRAVLRAGRVCQGPTDRRETARERQVVACPHAGPSAPRANARVGT